MLKAIYNVAIRECGIIRTNPIYLFCMVILPVIVVIFFTSLMQKGQPTDMPVGVVDQDNTPTTRQMIRTLDSFQSTKVTNYYNNINQARQAIQRNEIYAYIYFPRNTTANMLAMRQPNVSFYYSNASITSGALLYRDLKTLSMLASASMGAAKLSAMGATNAQINATLQPITIDLHPINNPQINYNIYLTGSLVPATLLLFISLMAAYSIGTELKFNRSKEWIKASNDNIFIALTGKLLPQFLVSLTVIYGFMFYIFQVLGFPHLGGTGSILLLGLLAVLAAQGFGIFVSAIIPSLRMSMSVCSLWAALSYSLMGATFPLVAMDSPIKAIAQMFPMRHFFVIYQTCVFNGYPLINVWLNLLALIIFAALPVPILKRLKRNMLLFKYIP